MSRRSRRPAQPEETDFSAEAQKYLHEVERRRLEILSRMRKLPVAALIWGQSPLANTPLSQVRLILKETLIHNGHLARFSEDLYDPDSDFSLLAQQIAQVESHDLVFSIPGSAGSIAEIHEFVRLPGVSHKIITFLDYHWNDGYSNKTLMELKSNVTSEIVLYDSDKLPNCIIDKCLDTVRRFQEVSWMLGRRV